MELELTADSKYSLNAAIDKRVNELLEQLAEHQSEVHTTEIRGRILELRLIKDSL